MNARICQYHRSNARECGGGHHFGTERQIHVLVSRLAERDLLNILSPGELLVRTRVLKQEIVANNATSLVCGLCALLRAGASGRPNNREALLLFEALSTRSSRGLKAADVCLGLAVAWIHHVSVQLRLARSFFPQTDSLDILAPMLRRKFREHAAGGGNLMTFLNTDLKEIRSLASGMAHGLPGFAVVALPESCKRLQVSALERRIGTAANPSLWNTLFHKLSCIPVCSACLAERTTIDCADCIGSTGGVPGTTLLGKRQRCDARIASTTGKRSCLAPVCAIPLLGRAVLVNGSFVTLCFACARLTSTLHVRGGSWTCDMCRPKPADQPRGGAQAGGGSRALGPTPGILRPPAHYKQAY